MTVIEKAKAYAKAEIEKLTVGEVFKAHDLKVYIIAAYIAGHSDGLSQSRTDNENSLNR